MTSRIPNGKTYLMNVLSGAALGVTLGLIPNAVLTAILTLFPITRHTSNLMLCVQVFQFLSPFMTGAIIAQNFKLKPLEQMSVGGAAMIGSGAMVYRDISIGQPDFIFQLAGMGDLINTMLTAAAAVLVVLLIGEKLGSVNIILLPIIVAAGVGYIGWLCYPAVSQITVLLGSGIEKLSSFSPVVTNLLIALIFGVLVVSPLATAAVCIAIGLNGNPAGAAAMGVTVATIFLTYATWKQKENPNGVSIAILLGAVKMMMPNFFAAPIMALPLAIAGALASIPVTLFNIVNTAQTGGFGIVGMVSPMASLEGPGMSVPLMLLCWIVIPAIIAIVVFEVFDRFVGPFKGEIFIYADPDMPADKELLVDPESEKEVIVVESK